MVDVNNHMFARGLQSTLSNNDSVVHRDHKLFGRLNFPGVNRHKMPAKAEKSE